jgi:hypothetical protein
MSNWGSFKQVKGRNNRRKQTKVGKFDNKKYNYKLHKTKTEYNFPNLKEPELERLKEKIKHKIKLENRRDLILFSIFVIVFVYLFYIIIKYLGWL